MSEYEACFTSPIQAMVLIRDALVDYGALAALNNDVGLVFLFSKIIVPRGVRRGVLVEPKGPATEAESDDDDGPRLFQSMSTLSRMMLGQSKPPSSSRTANPLEGFEAIFYFFCYTVLKFHGDGRKKSESDRVHRALRAWPNADPAIAYAAKKSLMTVKLTAQNFTRNIDSSTWGEPCRTLFERYRTFVQKSVYNKITIEVQKSSTDTVDSLTQSHNFMPPHEVVAHYREIKSYFDHAIGTYSMTFYRTPVSTPTGVSTIPFPGTPSRREYHLGPATSKGMPGKGKYQDPESYFAL
ncbi:hypothetical protein DFP72DRAFT_1081055 [Ephemerocybe angulata]|uniref:Uncharacterized protein n=1 Tax=Ephemerocybe angulata TaxID=980116 RepID=A0A8H6HBQ1_9AGAR|nr:hypothetical protein DFP72DRAFT_1081055 [Tulosesus angulatus]